MGIKKMGGAEDYRRKLLNDELRWLNAEHGRIVRF
jgi:hypothetical protein